MSKKTLLAMRHAKSSWKDSGLSDYERPLNKRGRLAAPLMAETLFRLDLVPQLIISSSAERARQTSEMLKSSWSLDVELVMEDSLYLAGPPKYVRALEAHADDQECVMLVGHNPGMEYLIEHLTGEDEIMPTAAIAIMSFEDAAWNQLSACTLHDVLRPKEISTDS